MSEKELADLQNQNNNAPIDSNAASVDPDKRRLSIRESIDAARKEYAESQKPSGSDDAPKLDAETKPKIDPDKDAKENLDNKLPDGAELKVEDTGKQPGTAEEKPTSLAAPSSWSKTARDKWTTLPSDIQQEIHRREEAGAQGVKVLKDRYADIDNALAPYQETMRNMGRTPGQAIQAMFQWNMALTGSNKVNSFKELAKSFGVDLAQLTPSQSGTTTPPEGANGNADLTGALRPLQDKITSLETILEQNARVEQERAANKGKRQLEEWSKDKPHYERVRARMHQLMALDATAMAQGQRPINGFIKDNDEVDLDALYMVACNTDPDIQREMREEIQRNAVVEAEKAQATKLAAAAKAADAKRKEVEKAKKASSSIPSQSAPTANLVIDKNKPRKGESVRDSILRARAEVNGED